MIPPGPGFVGLLRERARRSPARGFQRLQAPLGGRSKADHAAGSFARQSAKADHVTRTSSRRSAKADCPARSSPRRSAKADCPARTSSRRSAKADRASRTSSRRSAKADHAARTSSRRSAKADCAARTSSRRSAKADRAARTSSRRSAKADRAARTSPRRSAKAARGGRLCPARGFSGRAAGRNGALPYNARKSQFLRNGDVRATESLFLFAVLWLAFLPGPSETGVAGGGKARRPETRPPRGGPPNDRDRLPVFAPPARTPAPATPPQSACSRRRSGRPQRPNLFGRRLPESPKGKGKRKEEA